MWRGAQVIAPLFANISASVQFCLIEHVKAIISRAQYFLPKTGPAAKLANAEGAVGSNTGSQLAAQMSWQSNGSLTHHRYRATLTCGDERRLEPRVHLPECEQHDHNFTAFCTSQSLSPVARSPKSSVFFFTETRAVDDELTALENSTNICWQVFLNLSTEGSSGGARVAGTLWHPVL